MPRLNYRYRPSIRPVLLFLTFSLIILLLGNLFFLVTGNFIALDESEEKELYIPLGASLDEVASILHEEDIIQSPFVFKLYSRFKGYDQHIQAGQYSLAPGMPIDKVMEELQEGVVQAEGQKFTVPEGYTVEDIASRLDEKGIADKTAFLETCSTYENDSFDYLKEVPEEANYKIEGYLFPDTYEFNYDVSSEEIIDRMISRFDDIITDSIREKIEESPFSLHEILTLASIVQHEAKVMEEKPLIAAVFINRLLLEDMHLLQSCATVQYVLGEQKEVLTYEHLRVESSYNTYISPDLPPGPIGSPGKNAIEAVLEPADTDYLYFVSKEDGSGTHYFSETLEEHNRYKRMISEQGDSN